MATTEVPKTPDAPHEIKDYPLDTYMRLEKHMQKLRLAVMRLASQKAASEKPTQAHQQEALLELVSDPRLRKIMDIEEGTGK